MSGSGGHTSNEIIQFSPGKLSREALQDDKPRERKIEEARLHVARSAVEQSGVGWLLPLMEPVEVCGCCWLFWARWRASSPESVDSILELTLLHISNMFTVTTLQNKGNSPPIVHYVLSWWSVVRQLLEERTQETGSLKGIFQGLTFSASPRGIESSIPSSRRILQTLHLRSRLAEPLCYD